jgi:DNA polymerase-3 subunit alpha
LYKFDILSQRGLGKIRDCLDLIRLNQPDNPPHDIHDVNRFKHDDNINRLLREARALGCFYIESPGMRMLMLKLRTNSYLELVAASSIIRPGVAQSGMMREYILRHRVPERRSGIHPKMLELMPETYGVMVYQEDVIKVANQFAGLSLAESDILRRGMSGKFRKRDEFKHVRRLFFDNCVAKGYETEVIQAVWSQIESFAGFAFSKGHSASYAVESYQCLYLKTYYPLEYMVAVINNFGGFYRTEMYVHEARKLGATIELPCVNRSQVETTIEGMNVFLGFQHILGLELGVCEQILRERSINGPFHDFNDLLDRVLVPLEQLVLLIRIGALRSFGIPKRTLLWKAHLSRTKAPLLPAQPLLFSENRKSVEVPDIEEDPFEEAFEQLELLEFSLRSPFELLAEELPAHPLAADLERCIGKKIRTYGYMVNLKTTSTKDNQTMIFGTFLDREGELLDTVHFPNIARQFRFSGRGVYELRGTVSTEFDFQTIEVNFMRKVNYRPDPRYYDE